MNPLNTHTYDGALINCQQPKIHDFLKLVSIIDDIEKRSTTTTFVTEILKIDVSEKTQISITFLNIIMNSWGTQANFDATNNLSADNLMYVCAFIWNELKKSECSKLEKVCDLVDFSRVFFLQCEDIQTGSCPQGRVARLWQVVAAFIEIL